MRFVSSESPKLLPWVAHVTRVLRDAAPREPEPSGPDGLLVWQLVSANNRQLARSVTLHSTFSGATDAARAVVAASDSLAVQLVSEPGRGMYGWYATLDESPVMTCARWYVTDRDRRNAIALALRSVAVATLHEGARLTDPALMAGARVD